MESDEPDVFERKRKFETLLDRLNKHRNKTQLTLKGNDLRYNVYLKKMNKLTRSDLGLDFAAYKDYVSNLREFAHVNRDMDVFANESLSFGAAEEDKNLLQAATDFEGFNPDLKGAKRVKEHGPSVQMTVAKLMRKSSGYLNDRDRAALKELRENMSLYLLHDMVLFDQLMRLYYREKANSKVDHKHVEMLQELKNDLPIELMEECGVSKREFD